MTVGVVGSDPAQAALAGAFPRVRPRRLRRSEAMRRLAADIRVDPSDLVLPVFYREGAREPVPIQSMPGVVQHSESSFRTAVADAAAIGLGGVMIFVIPEHRDAMGTAATESDGPLARAVRWAAAESAGRTVVMADLCLDEFTDHGHCGVLSADGSVDNDRTLDRYAEMSTVLAAAGADAVGTSGMMDGQVGRIRDALDDGGGQDVAIVAYVGKAASAWYGPFREAVDSQLAGSRQSYQSDPAASRDAVRDAALDIREGADIVMVKPALGYLDVVYRVAQVAPVPVAAYQVSGEYAMVEAAAQRGWIDRRRAIDESLVSIRRAGASIIVTYWAAEVARPPVSQA